MAQIENYPIKDIDEIKLSSKAKDLTYSFGDMGNDYWSQHASNYKETDMRPLLIGGKYIDSTPIHTNIVIKSVDKLKKQGFKVDITTHEEFNKEYGWVFRKLEEERKLQELDDEIARLSALRGQKISAPKPKKSNCPQVNVRKMF